MKMRPTHSFRVLIAFGVLLMTHGCDTKSPDNLNLPKAEEIESVSVNLMGAFLNEPDTDEFELPRHCFSTLIECLSTKPVSSNNTVGFGKPIIVLDLTTKDRTIKIEIPWSGKNKLFFTFDGVAYERNGEYGMQNPITKTEMGFAPDEAMLLYRYLKKCPDTAPAQP